MIGLIGDVLQALSEPPWPLVVLILGVLLIFRKNVPTMFSRVKRLKGFGFEVELHEDLAKLQQQATQAAASATTEPKEHALSAVLAGKGGMAAALEVKTQARTAPTSPSITEGDSDTKRNQETASDQKSDDTESVVNAILDEAATDPKVALIRLSIEIEKELRTILGRAGFLAGQGYIPLPKALKILETDYKVLSPRSSPPSIHSGECAISLSMVAAAAETMY